MKPKGLQFKDFAMSQYDYYIADFMMHPNSRGSLHTHDFYEFIIILDGEFIETCNGKDINLPQKTIHVIKPEDVHYLSTTNKHPYNRLRNIAVKKSVFEQMLEQTGITYSENIFKSFTLGNSLFETYLKKSELLLQLNHNKQTNHFVFKSILSDILLESLVNRTNDDKIPEWLSRAYTEIAKDNRFVDGIPVFIELCGKTQEHITRVFRQHYHTTPSAYINQLRLQYAAYLLTTTDQKTLDIIFQCGFESVPYFNRLFKEQYQVTPRAYREKNKKLI